MYSASTVIQVNTHISMLGSDFDSDMILINSGSVGINNTVYNISCML